MPCISRLIPDRLTLRRVARLIPVLPLVMLCASCSDFWVSGSTIVSIKVSPTAVLLKAGATPADTFTLSSSALTASGSVEADTATAKWSSSNPSIVTAATGGVITAATSTAFQTATITAKDGGETSTCAILTYTGNATTLSVSTPNGTSIAPGGSLQLAATLNGLTNFNLASYVTWTSSDTSVAVVSNTGLVTLVGTPSVTNFTVTATAYFGAAASQSTITSLPAIINIT